MSWVPLLDKKSNKPTDLLWCDVHDPDAAQPFGKLGAGCVACTRMRTPIQTVDTTVPVPTPAGCRSQADHERALTEAADYALVQAKAIRDDKEKNSRPSESLSVKWFELHIKATRAAAELGRGREEIEDDARLTRAAAKIHGGSGN